mgnify:CR=1 FL=1
MSYKKKEKETVLMLFVLYATFVKRDVAILEKNYNVDLYQFNTCLLYTSDAADDVSTV